VNNTRTQIVLRINRCAGEEDFYAMSKEMGEFAAQIFVEPFQPSQQSAEQKEKALEKHRAQLTGLETIAETTLKVTDVLDFIKKQMARPQAYWRKPYTREKAELQGKRFGEGLMSYIEGYIKQEATKICDQEVPKNKNTDEWKIEMQHIYLQLVRQFIRQIVAHYEYCVSLKV
jgi:hypothetical protein